MANLYGNAAVWYGLMYNKNEKTQKRELEQILLLEKTCFSVHMKMLSV